MKLQKRRAVLSIIIGIVLALVFFEGAVTITKDFSYYRIFGIGPVNLNEGTDTDTYLTPAVGWQYEGKEVFASPSFGFPLSPYTDCVIRGSGMIHFDIRCLHRVNLLSALVIAAVDVLFWAVVAYGIISLIQNFRKKKRN